MEENSNNYISLQEATQYCNYSREYLSLRARQGKLKAVKIGRDWVTRKEWIEEYLKRVKENNNFRANGINIPFFGRIATNGSPANLALGFGNTREVERKSIAKFGSNHILSIVLSFFIGLILSFFLFYFLIYAAPPGSPYNPGETLAPDCAPGAPNCTVYPPVPVINYQATIGEDKLAGIPNTAGAIKLFSAGDNALYTTFTAIEQTANADYTLPVSLPDANKILQSTAAGVLTWVANAAGGAPVGEAYVTIGNTGNLSAERALTGTANRVSVTDGGGNSTVTLSAPQDIHTGASPTFAGMTVTGLTNQRIVFAGAGGVLSDTADLMWAIDQLYAYSSTVPPVNSIYRSSSTNTVASSYIAEHRTTGDMVDGFGSQYLSTIRDNSGIGYAIGTMGFIRAGTDDTGDFIIRPALAGGFAEKLRLTSAGNLTFSGSLGTSSSYISNAYITRLYLNSTAYLDGATAGWVNIYPANGVNILDASSPELRLTETSDANTRVLQLKVNNTATTVDIVSTFGATGAWPMRLMMVSTAALTIGTSAQVNLGTATTATAAGQLGLTRLYLNSAAYLDGATAGAANFVGNVGINETLPDDMLHIKGSTASNYLVNRIKLEQDYATWGTIAQFNAFRFIETVVTNPADGIPKAFNVGAGGVGIGTTPPIYNSTDALSVSGGNINLNSNKFYLNSTAYLDGATAGSIVGSTSLTAATGNEVGYNLAMAVNKATSGVYTGLGFNITETSAPGFPNYIYNFSVGGVERLSARFWTTPASTSSITQYLFARGANSLTAATVFATKTSGGVNTGGAIGHNGADNVTFISGDTSLTEDVVIDSNGKVGIGDTTPDTVLDVVGLTGSAAGPYLRYTTATGEIYYDSSSERYKENITPLADDFLKILEAQPKSFTDKATQQREIGYIAENFQELGLTNLLYYDGQGLPESIKYEKIPLYLVEVAKLQQQQIEEIKALLNSEGAAVTTDSSPTFLDKLKQDLAALGFIIENGIVRVKTLVVENLKVGSPEKPAGITIYDEETGQPYCIKMKGGQLMSTTGECSDQSTTNPTPEEPVVIPQPEPQPEPQPQPEPPAETPSQPEPVPEFTPQAQALEVPPEQQSAAE